MENAEYKNGSLYINGNLLAIVFDAEKFKLLDGEDEKKVELNAERLALAWNELNEREK